MAPIVAIHPPLRNYKLYNNILVEISYFFNFTRPNITKLPIVALLPCLAFNKLCLFHPPPEPYILNDIVMGINTRVLIIGYGYN